jgi:hypothetical protein
MANNEWIITPELKKAVDDFLRLYEHLKDKQGRKYSIMILGDRGVGKSLFVENPLQVGTPFRCKAAPYSGTCRQVIPEHAGRFL